MKIKSIFYLILFVSILALPLNVFAQHDHSAVEEITHYTCGMHPSVKITPENYKKGDTQCPICSMPLIPVTKSSGQEESFGEDVISRVNIKARELKLAGVKTVPVIKRKLFKDIRAVGSVAYDPQLAIAQDEYISAVKAFGKAKGGQIPEITQRAEASVESSKRKLFLLGLNKDQIKELGNTLKVEENLILPGDKMWIYGDIFEYELNWVKKDSYVRVRPISLVGEEFWGKIVSINPVIDPQTRSVRFRALVDNPGRRLKPEMYVDIQIMSQYTDPEGNEEVLSIPKSAMLDTGRRRIVWVDTGKGQFEGRAVVVGPEAIDNSNDFIKFYPVLKGLKEGDMVVTKGNFLIDSQSQITGVMAASYGGALESTEPKGSRH